MKPSFLRRSALVFGSLVTVFLGALALQPMKSASADAATVSIVDVQHSYDAECAGILHGDYSVLEGFMAPDYFHITSDGRRRTLQEVIADEREVAQKIVWSKCSSVARDLWQSGPNTKIIASNAEVGTLETKDGNEPVQAVTISIDVWTLRAGQPREVSATDLQSIVVVGGKAQVSQLPPQSP